MNEVFIDTNLAIAWVFYVNSLHQSANNVFELYDNFFWSTFVKDEFDNRFDKKLDNISSFFNDFQMYLEKPEKDFYSFDDLFEFILTKYSGKKMNDAKNAIFSFWSNYIGIESQISFFDMINYMNICLSDLTIDSNLNKMALYNLIKLTPQRVDGYSKINNILKRNGVHKYDRNVILDGHDFACFSPEPVDFITFDNGCYCGAKNVELLCFNSIKGKNDFN